MEQMLQAPDGGRQVGRAAHGRRWRAACILHVQRGLTPCTGLTPLPFLRHTPQMTKRNIRGDFAAEWEAFCEGEVEGAWAMLSSAKVAAALGGVLERLSGGRKPPPSRL